MGVFHDTIYGTINNHLPLGVNDGSGTDQDLTLVAGYADAMKWLYAGGVEALAIDTSPGAGLETWTIDSGDAMTIIADGSMSLRSATDVFFGYETTSSPPIATMGSSGTVSRIKVTDNEASAFILQQSTNNYLLVNTLNTGAFLDFGNTATNPIFRWFGSGEMRDSTGSAGAATNVWTSNGPGLAPSWQVGGAGAGDVVGPGSSTDEAIARFNGTTGKIIQNSVVTITDTGDITGATSITVTESAITPALIVNQTSTGAIALFQDSGNTVAEFLDGGTFHITSFGGFNFDGTDFDIDPTGQYTVSMDAGQRVAYEIADALDSSWNISQGANVLLSVDTNTAVDQVRFFQTSADGRIGINVTPTGTLHVVGSSTAEALIVDQTSTGDIFEFRANGLAVMILDDVGNLAFTGQNLNLDPTGDFLLDMDLNERVILTVSDNEEEAFLLRESTNGYLKIDTRTAAQAMSFGNASTNPTYNFLGTSLTSLGGQIKISGGSPGASKILTSDATGLATWETTPTQLATFDANTATFPAVDPAAATSRNENPLLAFVDSDTDEAVIFHGIMGAEYISGTSMTVDIDWVSELAPTPPNDIVIWEVEIERIAPGGEDIDAPDGFAAGQKGTSTANATSGIVTRSSIILTTSKADFVAPKDAYRMRIHRRALTDAADTLVGDAQILRVGISQ